MPKQGLIQLPIAELSIIALFVMTKPVTVLHPNAISSLLVVIQANSFYYGLSLGVLYHLCHIIANSIAAIDPVIIKFVLENASFTPNSTTLLNEVTLFAILMASLIGDTALKLYLAIYTDL